MEFLARLAGFALLILLCLAVSGSSGEPLVAKHLGRLPEGTYRILHDVMLPTVDGMTTQVDHVVVSPFGIFVIETKDYGGWIFGDEGQRQWTQCFRSRDGSQKFHFQNPIRQNWRHIFTMSDLLKLPRHYFHNVVVFAGDAEFRTEMPENVLHARNLVGYILSHDESFLTERQVDWIVRNIGKLDASIGEERRAAHVHNLLWTHDSDQLALACEKGVLKCPKCGAPMVRRRRRSDGAPFYGCSQYPACKGTRDA